MTNQSYSIPDTDLVLLSFPTLAHGSWIVIGDGDHTMAARSFGFGTPKTAVTTAIDDAACVLARVRCLPRWFARQANGTRWRALSCRQIAWFDDRTLRDI